MKIDLEATTALLETPGFDLEPEYTSAVKAHATNMLEELKALRAYAKSGCCCGEINCSKDKNLREFYRGVKK